MNFEELKYVRNRIFWQVEFITNSAHISSIDVNVSVESNWGMEKRYGKKGAVQRCHIFPKKLSCLSAQCGNFKSRQRCQPSFLLVALNTRLIRFVGYHSYRDHAAPFIWSKREKLLSILPALLSRWFLRCTVRNREMTKYLWNEKKIIENNNNNNKSVCLGCTNDAFSPYRFSFQSVSGIMRTNEKTLLLRLFISQIFV